MYMRKTTKISKGKTYTHYLLVESVHTPKGPRQRTICPLSEHAMPAWLRRTALGDILGTEFATLTEDALYRNLDKLHPHREQIERELAAREQQLFHLDGTIYLYDLTSTYFEGQVVRNRQAKRGYSRDKRSDCKQVLVGLVLDRDGFP